jgi:hypothetical protein
MIYSPKLDKEMWNDGPALLDFMGREGAPTVAGKHLCCGGGGGQPNAPPQAPDYSSYITAMSNVGNQLTGYGGNLYNWAGAQGVDLSGIAGAVSGSAAQNAAWASNNSQNMMTNWENTYGPIYQAQAARTQQFTKDLPQTEEQWAGQYGANTAQAFDASKAAATRKLQGYGLSAPGIGSAAIDAASASQRAAAVTASANQGRMAAMQYGDQLTGQTEQAGQIFPQVSGAQSNLALGFGNQQVNAPESAVSTTAGAYQPYLSSYSTAYPYLGQWGQTMQNSYNQTLQGYSTFTNAQQQANQQSSGWGALAGAVIGGAAKVGAAFAAEEGGMIPGPTSAFVAAGNVVPPTVSPSQGRQTDDVAVPIMDGGEQTGKGAINVGEFIWPKDVVAWRGEKWMQNEVAKARKERQSQTVAAPEHVPAGQSPAQAFEPMRRAA